MSINSYRLGQLTAMYGPMAKQAGLFSDWGAKADAGIGGIASVLRGGVNSIGNAINKARNTAAGIGVVTDHAVNTAKGAPGRVKAEIGNRVRGVQHGLDATGRGMVNSLANRANNAISDTMGVPRQQASRGRATGIGPANPHVGRQRSLLDAALNIPRRTPAAQPAPAAQAKPQTRPQPKSQPATPPKAGPTGTALDRAHVNPSSSSKAPQMSPGYNQMTQAAQVRRPPVAQPPIMSPGYNQMTQAGNVPNKPQPPMSPGMRQMNAFAR